MHAVVALLLALAVSTPPQQRVEMATGLGAASFDEIAAMPAMDVHVDRPERERPVPRGEITAFAPSRIDTDATLAAPALGRGFLDNSIASTIIPADATGAVSATQMVGANNSAITVRDRNGNQLNRISLSGMWQTIGAYDPRVAYDATSGRWLIVALRDDGATFMNSKLLIAVSDGDDATGSWHRYTIAIDATNKLSADFPRVAIAQNEIIITTDLWTTGTDSALLGADVRLLNKTAAYSGMSALPLSATTDSWDTLTPVSIQDAGNRSAWYVASVGNNIRVIDADIGVQVAEYTAPVAIYGNCCGFGPQVGTSVTMDVGAPWIHYAVVRGRKLWLVQSFTPAHELSAILVWRIDLGNYDTKGWVIDDPAGATAYAFPSFAVNKFGAALVGYSVFSGSTHPSAGFSYIAPNGEISAPAILQSGSGTYTISRWGDFSTTVVDPADDTSFWTLQTIAMTRTATSPVWGTWWTEIPMPHGPLKHHATHH